MNTIKLMLMLGMVAIGVSATAVIHGQDAGSTISHEQLINMLDNWSRRGEHTPAENEQIQTLPKESISASIELLRIADDPRTQLKLMHVLTYKLREFNTSISQQIKQDAFEAIIEKCRNAKEEDIAVYLMCIEYLSDADFRQVAARVKVDKGQKVKNEIDDFVQHRKVTDL